MIKDIKTQPVLSYLSLNQKTRAMKAKIITGILFLSLTGLTVTAQNLLKNGDFELSQPDGSFLTKDWHTDWVPNESGLKTTSTSAMAGRCGVWMYTALHNDLSYARFSQEIRCTPGNKYKAEVYLRTPEGLGWIPGSVAYISLDFKSVAGVTINTVLSEKLITKNTDWKLFSLDAVAPEKAALVRYTINLESRKGQSICNADNCRLILVR